MEETGLCGSAALHQQSTGCSALRHVTGCPRRQYSRCLMAKKGLQEGQEQRTAGGRHVDDEQHLALELGHVDVLHAVHGEVEGQH